MNKTHSNIKPPVCLIAAALVAIASVAQSAEKVTLKDAYKDIFYVGVAVNRPTILQSPVRADNVNRTPEELAKDLALVKEQFSQIVPENDTKWALIHPNEGPDGYDFAPADAFVNFGLSNNIYLVGHTLIWHSQTPNWVFAGTNMPPAAVNPPAPANAGAAGTNAVAGGRGRGFGGGPGRGPSGPRASREELLERMREHIHTVVGRYKGKIKVWDVVNEALADGGGTNILRTTQWTQIVGDDFIAKAFQFAHEADPDAILRYNDYGLENPGKRRKLIALIKQLQEQKIPVGAIGTQTHINVGTTFESMDQTLTELETLGLPIHVTELDINSSQGGQRAQGGDLASVGAATSGGIVSEADRKQTEAYSGLFRALVKHQNSVKVVTFWGINDGVTWLRNAKPLLFDANDQPKPAFDAVIKAAADAKK
jgi:endo-1,4-beta-xylanase